MKFRILGEYLPVVQIGLQTLCIIAAGRVSASRGWLDAASVCRALNRVVVVACLPALQFWLLAIKTDMRNMEHWRAVGAFMMWTLLVQMGCTAWVLLFEGGKLSRIAVHSMILVANNTGILAPVVLEAALGPSMAVVGMLATIVLYFQQLPVATVLFELDRAADCPSGGTAGGDGNAEGDGEPAAARVVGSPPGMYGGVKPVPGSARDSEGTATGDEERGLRVVAPLGGAAPYGEESWNPAAKTTPGAGGDPWASPGSEAQRRHDNGAQQHQSYHPHHHHHHHEPQQQRQQQHHHHRFQDGQLATAFGATSAAAAAATGTAGGTVWAEAKTSSPGGCKDLSGPQSAEVKARLSPTTRFPLQRSLRTGPGTPESEGKGGQRSGLAGRRWGSRLAARAQTTAATQREGSGDVSAETERRASPTGTHCRSEDVVHTWNNRCTEAAESYIRADTSTPSVYSVRSILGSPASDDSPHEALGQYIHHHQQQHHQHQHQQQHQHHQHQQQYHGPGGPQHCPQRLPRGSPAPSDATYPHASWAAGAADDTPCSHARVAPAAATPASQQQQQLQLHTEEHSLRHAAQLVLSNALMWTTGAATALSMLGLHAVLDPDVPSHVPELGFVEGTLAWLARCSVPVSLFSMGLFMSSRPGCGLGSAKSSRVLLGYLGLRMLVLPWLMVFVNSLLGLGGRLAKAMVMLTCVPVGSMAFVVSEQYGEGAEAVTLVMQTGLMLMLPHVAAMMAVMRWMGLYMEEVTA